MSRAPILTELRDRVLTLTLDRPEQRNALDDAAFAALLEALDRAEGDAAVRAVAIAASGPHFSAGADVAKLRALVEGDPAASLAQAKLAATALRRLALLEKPTVALVQGDAHGAGVGLILACDIAIAEDSARFGLGEVRFGLFPGLVAPLLVQAVGRRQAARLLLTGRRFDAREAQRLGVVQEVVPPGGLDAALRAAAAAFRGNAPGAMAATKRLLRDARYGGAIEDWDLDWLAGEVARHRGEAEAREGVAAFLEKRWPAWANGDAAPC